MKRVAILNSRQSKTPAGADPWVLRTLDAVEWAKENGHDVISSVGQFTWDLVSWAAFRQGLHLDLVIPPLASDACEAIAGDLFGPGSYESDRIRWIRLESSSSLERKTWWRTRDQAVIESADIAIPVSLRPGSGLSALITSRSSMLEVFGRFQTPYQPTAHHVRSLIDPARINPELERWPAGFLIHWTRLSHGPWPGESKAEYFRDFVGNISPGAAYHRSAFATLSRILREGRIRASAWKTGQRTPMVAFTECSPLESIPLMRWRSRWSRWSFEPYGIALHRDWLAAQGARPVRYVAEREWMSLSAEEKPWSHRRGRAAEVWPPEREWRHSGNLRIDHAPPDAIRILARTPEDVANLAAPEQIPVTSILR